MIELTNTISIITTESAIDQWARYLSGDKQSYTELVGEYARPLYRYGYRFCQDRELVKDCVQDVFADLWNSRDRISRNIPVKWYLFKAVRNRLMRQQSKWASAEVINDQYSFCIELDLEKRLIDSEHKAELAARIKYILSRLPDRQKEILYLRYYEELSFEEICDIMQIKKQSIHNLLQKAYKSFRSEWLWVVLLINCG